MIRLLRYLFAGLLLLVAAGCGPGDAPLPTPVLPLATPPAAPPAATATTVLVPTATPSPPAPTATSVPSPTPTPTAVPAPAVIGDMPRFAIDPIDQTPPEGITALQASGTQLIRLFVSWAQIEPAVTDPPTYHWDVYDPVLARFAAAGIGVIVSIQSCPSWACQDPAGPLDKASPDRFAEFVAALAAHYSAAPYNIRYWEIFNEPDTTNPPDHQGSFGLHGDQYAALLKAAVPHIRAVNADARVLLGGLAYEWFMDEQPPGPFNRNFLRDVVKAGGAPYFDYLNFHYYPQNPHWPSIADKATALRSLMASLGINKPLVCTEVGITSEGDPRWTAPGWPLNSEAVQSRFLVRAYAEGFAGGLTSMAWFTLHDWSNDNAGLRVFFHAGLTRDDWSYKPALTAYHTLVGKIGTRPFERTLDAATLGTPVLAGAAFGTPGDEVWIVWSRAQDTTAPLALPGGKTVHGYDLSGAPLAISGPTLTVGPDPVYIEVSGAR